MQTVIFLKGEPELRHKWSRTWVNEGCNRIRICMDDIISSISPRFWREGLSIASASCLNILINSLRLDMNVVIDAPNSSRLEWNRLEATARKIGAEIIWKDLDDNSSIDQEDHSQICPSE